MNIPLREYADVTLNGSGDASVTIGPVPTFTTWRITRISVNGTGAVQPTVGVYRGSASPANYVDGTSSGNNDSSDYPDGALVLQQGETLIVVWVDGTAGAAAGVRVEGVAG